ncbi:MAG TPA: ABC transporter substrate-binding protein, partial [Burkholderiaceae bacterium]|nr:ABC transporter substrate-binding protein [Burkholderiaceae bacterium]
MNGRVQIIAWRARHLVRVAGAALALAGGLAGCGNNPWPDGSEGQSVIRSAMTESTPRHLDPTASYWSNDTVVTYQVYEPPYGYHYLKRPFELVPKSAAAVVKPTYLDKDGNKLPDDAPAELVAESVYDVPIKPGIKFQPHPAFAKDAQGKYLYHSMKPGELGDRRTPMDFKETGTRELTAEDFVYAVKRHATTRITTPIYGIFSEYVLGLKEYGDLIKAEDKKLRQGMDPASQDKPFLDFRQWPLIGATAPEKDLLRLRIKGKYPQWKYWMQMTFMAPIPWEADAFYAQPGMAERGMTLDQWPVGTGPYMVTEFTKDRRIVMQRNPNYRGEPYPCEGNPGDKEKGLLEDCGKPTPFIDTIIATVEREATPLRNKFRDGYYDLEIFERTDTGNSYIVEANDSEEVRADYKTKGFEFAQSADVNSYIVGFNMLDPVIGWGDTPEQRERNRKLRQAISIAIDWEEYSKIFPKKAGETAMSPLPQGIPGSREGTPEGINPVTHRLEGGKAVRRSIEEARQLMVEAGFPQGRDAKTGRPLVIAYDFFRTPTPERKPQLDGMVRQFAKPDHQLEGRTT